MRRLYSLTCNADIRIVTLQLCGVSGTSSVKLKYLLIEPSAKGEICEDMKVSKWNSG